MEPFSAPQENETFELLIGIAGERGYPLTVTQSPAGEANAICRLDPYDGGLRNTLSVVESRETDKDFLVELGDYLFDEIFVEEVATLYRSSLSMVRALGKQMRVQLRIEPPELAALPWEYLHDADENVFLATSPETALVRFVPMRLPVRPSRIKLPLRVLVVLARPRDLPTLDMAQERALMEDALAERIDQGDIVLHFVEQATVANLTQAMRSFEPHIFHFVGHGAFVDDQAEIALVDGEGNAHFLDELAVRELFAGCRKTRMAVLNACQTATTSSTMPLAGLAPRLLQRQLSAVVAMQYPITDQSALIFARDFYRSLALGYGVDWAISDARKGIYLEVGGDKPDWGMPVLFLRAKDAHLFELAKDDAAPMIDIPPPPTPERPPEVSGFIGREHEIDLYTEQLSETNLAVIAGMAGVGKTSLAAHLAAKVGTEPKVFWHSFRPSQGLEVLIWKIASFLYWNQQPKLWQMLQGFQQGRGDPPPADVLFDYALEMVNGRGYLICLDDLHHVEPDPLLTDVAKRLLAMLGGEHTSVIITSRRIPDFVSLTDFDALSGLTYEDAVALLATRGLTLTTDMVGQLYTHTEGNAELLTIAANALVRASQPERLIARLVETSDVERFLLGELDESLTEIERSIETAVALLGQASVRPVIERILEQKSLRRPLQELSERFLLTVHDGEWQRLYDQHAILRAFYHDAFDRGQVCEMHRRAATYYQEEDKGAQRYLKAAQHYLAAGDDEKAAQAATLDLWSTINAGNARALGELFQQFAADKLTPESWINVQIASGEINILLREDDLALQSINIAYMQLNTMASTPANRLQRARVCRAMGQLLQHTSPGEALDWLQRGLDELSVVDDMPTGIEPDPRLRQRALMLVIRGHIHVALGEYDIARIAIEEALSFFTDEPDSVRARALLNLANIYTAQGDLEQATAANMTALAISEQLHDHFLRTKLLANMGIDQELAGDWTGAIANYRQAMALAEEQGNALEQMRIKNSLGVLLTKRGEFHEAHLILTQAISLARRHGLAEGLLYMLTSLAELSIQSEDWEAAEHNLIEAEALAQSTGVKYPLVSVYYNYAQVYRTRGEIEQAQEHAAHAVQVAQELGVDDQKGIALRVLGQTQDAAGRPTRAQQTLAESLRCLDGGDPYEIARTQAILGELLIRSGEETSGREWLRQTRETFATLGAIRDLTNLPTL